MSRENKKGIDLQGKEAYLTSLTLIRKNTVIGYFDIFLLFRRLNKRQYEYPRVKNINIYISHIVITIPIAPYD
jgi:hypothetical protein